MFSWLKQVFGDNWRRRLRCLGAGLGVMGFTPAQLAVTSDLLPVIEARIPGGNADAAALIQAAVDRAASSHATVKLPAGSYFLARSVVIPGGMGLEGDANGTTLAPLGTNGSNPVLLDFPVGTTRVSVRHLLFDGGGIDFTNASPLVTATGASYIVFDGVTVRNSRGAGLLMQGGMRDSGVQQPFPESGQPLENHVEQGGSHPGTNLLLRGEQHEQLCHRQLLSGHRSGCAANRRSDTVLRSRQCV